MKKPRALFGLQDVGEIIVGAILLAFPIAITEEVWTLSRELPLGRVLWISLSSIVVISWFGYYLYYRSSLRKNWRDFLKRIGTIYFLTLFISALTLASIDKLHLFTEPILAIKRAIIVAFAASFVATVVDSLR